MCNLSFKMFVMFATHILYCTLHFAVTIMYCSYLQQNSFMYLKDKYKKRRNIINSCYYGERPNVTKKNLIIIKFIIVWKWNHLFMKNYFRKKKINYCYRFMPGDFTGHLWFNGQQKLPVAGLNWNPRKCFRFSFAAYFSMFCMLHTQRFWLLKTLLQMNSNSWETKQKQKQTKNIYRWRLSFKTQLKYRVFCIV